VSVVISTVFGADIAPFLPALARLRMSVFREFPYLYEGTEANETRYLQNYVKSPQSMVVLASTSDGAIVGASTAMPAPLAGEDVSAPLRAVGVDPATVFYFGESVLLPAWRGQRLGHSFFDEREAAARSLGFATAAFCAVDRGESHPAQPFAYRSHDVFWHKRGFVRMTDVTAKMTWLDVGETAPTEKRLPFWYKKLS
jgi:GNAT superfamily N-acetyltransferase